MEQPPSYEWDELGSEIYYHKFELYKLNWTEIDFAEVLFAAAPYGGAIAITRDDEKFQRYRGQSSARGSVVIYSSVGDLLREIRWESVSIKALGWTGDERLIIVSKDGLVRYYDLLGNFSQFSLIKHANDGEVLGCKFWQRGLIAHITNNVFVRVDDLTEPRPHVMLNVHLTAESSVLGWTVIPPTFTASRQAECLVAVDKTIISLDGTDSQDMSLEHGPFTDLEISPNGQFLALRSNDGKIWVSSADFQRTLTEYDAGEDFQPRQIAWCGNDALVTVEGSIVTVIGPSSDTLRYAYDSAVALCSDVDGLRLFSSNDCDFLRKVPDTSERIFAPGSTSAASVLLDAIDQLEAKSAKADENIRMIQSYLAEAVDDCIKAASESLSAYWQKQLLKAASFGKGFLDLYNSDEFVDTCESLRVMNAVKSHDIGLPLTFEQYIRITPEGLIDRLLQRKHHYLASRICGYLRISPDHVYVHWACLKIQNSNENTTTTCDAIVQKLGSRKQISYEQIARTAFADGRVDLATLLLEHEPRAGAQVSLLLDMGQDEAALSKAVISGDPDLLSHVVFHVKDRQPLAVFFRMIDGKAAAIDTLIRYATENDLQLLKDFYYQDDRKLEGADLVLKESQKETDRSQQYTKAKFATRMISDVKELQVEHKALEDNARLMQLQDSLTKEFGTPFTDLSVLDIILKVLALGNANKAQKIATTFKVPDLTFTWLQLRSYISQRDWQSLEKWIFRQKKPIVPFEMVASHVHAAGNKKLAAQIVTKCSSGTTRIEAYIKMEDGLLAAREAYKIKDMDSLRQAQSIAKEGVELSEINDLMNRLQEGR